MSELESRGLVMVEGKMAYIREETLRREGV